MNRDRRRAVAALTAAGLLWGTTVPLSKLALVWLSPGWLTFARFGLAAAILLVAARGRVRAACSPAVLASGAIGYGGSVVVQNAGISRTSVSHAALLIGATPVLIAIIAAVWHRTVARPVAWAGFALSLAGVGLVAGGGGGGATASGDGLVLASLLLSAMFTVAQVRLLPGRDPVAVTAVQFLGAAIVMLPFAMATSGMPAAPAGPGPVLATAGLVAGGTLLPFTFFAYGQSRVSAEVAGAFLNLEPLVGAAAGVAVFGDPAGLAQVTGGAGILAGIALSSLPLLAGNRRRDGRPSSRGDGAEPVPLRVGHDRPGTRAVLRLHDGGAEGFQARQIPGVDVQVHPVLGGLGLRNPVDPDRALRRGPGQQSAAAGPGLPGTAERGRPERTEPGRVSCVQAHAFESRDRHGTNLARGTHLGRRRYRRGPHEKSSVKSQARRSPGSRRMRRSSPAPSAYAAPASRPR
jgi:O-acetylserine/cysteine efflux transporter